MKTKAIQFSLKLLFPLKFALISSSPRLVYGVLDSRGRCVTVEPKAGTVVRKKLQRQQNPRGQTSANPQTFGLGVKFQLLYTGAKVGSSVRSLNKIVYLAIKSAPPAGLMGQWHPSFRVKVGGKTRNSKYNHSPSSSFCTHLSRPSSSTLSSALSSCCPSIPTLNIRDVVRLYFYSLKISSSPLPM